MSSHPWLFTRPAALAGLGLLLTSSFLGACGGDAPAGAACRSQSECEGELVCLDGFCRESVGIGETGGSGDVTVPDLDALTSLDSVPGPDGGGQDAITTPDGGTAEDAVPSDAVADDAVPSDGGAGDVLVDDTGDIVVAEDVAVPDDVLSSDDTSDVADARDEDTGLADAIDPDVPDAEVPDVLSDVQADVADVASDVDAGADADADAVSDADTTVLNACGGTVDLSGSPGDSCSACGGRLACATVDSLECVGDTTNACGGCDALEGEPGGSCGACGGGTLACSGANALRCTDAGGLNECGGCSVLDGQPGEACGECGDGEWVCAGATAVECVGASEPNACGGCSALTGAPGDSCGTCGGGVLSCAESGESLLCTGATAPNQCGTCGRLAGPAGNVGDACGACGDGRLFCNAGGTALTCRGASLVNACGTCGPISGTLGAACGECGDGRLVCNSTGSALTCEGGSSRNACGGCGTLAGSPGASCGACGDGRFECNDARTAVDCVGASAVNACGTCGTLSGTPGAACGVCGTQECASGTGTDATGVVCNDPGANACGGCGTVTPGAPGASCGRCGVDTLSCSGPSTTTCSGNTTNACGGCTALSNTVGNICTSFSCFGGTGRWTCSGANALTCDCDSQICGNGILEGGEQCDDGNRTDTDTCANNCELNFTADPDDLAGTCANPIVVPPNQQFVWDLCGRGDNEDNIAGPQDCIDAVSRGEDLVFQFTLATRSTVRIDAFDADNSAAVDAVVYLRRGTCSDASTQVICDDDVPCASGRPEFGGACIGGVQPRQASLTTILDAGTWFVVLDSYNVTRSGTAFTCGETYLSIRSL